MQSIGASPWYWDQPEDHLDGQYIASAVVRHLEAAKERRQVLIATHSPNLVVLGDSELVVPMRVKNGRGEPYAIGAVDRPETRDQICALLEGGTEAYKKRGRRYGFLFSADPPPSPQSDGIDGDSRVKAPQAQVPAENAESAAG